MSTTHRQDRLDEIEAIRASLELSQGAMASLMGISTRTYEELASGRTQVRHLHVAAARQSAIEYATDMRKSSMLPSDLRDFIRSAAQILEECERERRT